MKKQELKKQEKVFIRLPWLGPTSAAFGNRIRRVTHEAIPICKPVCVFTTRRMLTTCVKDHLPTESLSNVVYLFNCACGHSYVRRTIRSGWTSGKSNMFLRGLFTSAECQEDEESRRRRRRRRRRRWRRVSAQVPAPGCFGLGVGS